MPNLGQLIKFQTGMDVRKGIPSLKLGDKWKELEDPRNATVLGLLLTALNEAEEDEPSKEFFFKKKKKKTRSTQPGFFSQMKKEVTRQVTLFFEDEQDTEMF
jgi:cell division protein FtsA